MTATSGEGPLWRRKIGELFGLDVRSLALFRIGVAIVLLCDLGTRFRDLHAHYCDDGVLPIGILPTPGASLSDIILPVSLHLVDGSSVYQTILFGLAALVALAMLVGWHTRLATVLAWFLTTSLYARNPLVSQAGDAVLRLLLFWGMFLPLGACCSLDSRFRPTPPRRVLSAATAALLLQMCVLMWFSALLKYDPAWRSEGDAVYRALAIGHMRTWIGDLVFQSRALMTFLTFATLVQEGLVPFLLLVPWKTWLFRLIVIGTFVCFHAGLGLCMELGNFQPVCILGWLALLPTESWDWIAARLRRSAQDGLLGAPAFRRLREWLARPGSRAVGAGDERGAGPTRELPSLIQPLGVVADVAISFLFLYLVVVSINNWTEPRSRNENAALRTLLDVRDTVRRHFHVQNANLGYALALDAQWYLFAPKPTSVHGWLVVDGTLNDGSHVDLLPFCLERREAALSWERPRRIADLYPNQRWRKYLTNLIAVPADKVLYRHAFAVYVALEWNRAHDREPARRLQTLDVYLMRETTQPNYQPVTHDRVRLVRLDCRADNLRAASSADLKPVVLPR